MGSFKENVGMFFTELMQDSIKNLKECDENYKDIRSTHRCWFHLSEGMD